MPPFGADDAAGDALAQAEGAADGEHEVADLQGVAIAEASGHEVGSADRHDGDVGIFVAPDLIGMGDAAVGEVDAYQILGRVPNDVAIGEDVVGVAELDDDAGAGFLDALETAAVFGGERRFDVDDGRADKLDDALDQAELALHRIDIAGEGGEFPFAIGVRGGRRGAGRAGHGGFGQLGLGGAGWSGR